MSLKETIFFYTRNDYLIINSFLCNRVEQLHPIIEFVNNDSKAILKEVEDGAFIEDEYKKFYENRIFDQLNEEVVSNKKEVALNDLHNIYKAMSNAEDDLVLNRTIWPDRIAETFNGEEVGDMIELANISSTLKTYYREDEGRDFYRYEITIKKGQKMLDLDQFPPFVRNEDGEVLLPPMTAKVTNVKDDDNPNCLSVICIECEQQKFTLI